MVLPMVFPLKPPFSYGNPQLLIPIESQPTRGYLQLVPLPRLEQGPHCKRLAAASSCSLCSAWDFTAKIWDIHIYSNIGHIYIIIIHYWDYICQCVCIYIYVILYSIDIYVYNMCIYVHIYNIYKLQKSVICQEFIYSSWIWLFSIFLGLAGICIPL